MFNSTRLPYILGAAAGGIAAGVYVAWSIFARFSFIAALNDRSIVEPHVMIVLGAAAALIAFPLGVAAGLGVTAIVTRIVDYARRSRDSADGNAHSSWVTRRNSGGD